jgi:hypothetical protein
MFTATQSEQIELDGMSDDRPIRLDGLSRETFKLFLEHTFGRYVNLTPSILLTVDLLNYLQSSHWLLYHQRALEIPSLL